MKPISKIIGLALLLLGSSLGAAEWKVDEWGQTLYFRYTFGAAAAGDGTLRITAVDEYEVFFNGTLFGSDADWSTMEEYAIEIGSQANDIAVIVQNRGSGLGSGLLVEIATENESWVSTPSGLNEIWRWTEQEQAGSDWTTADVSGDDAWFPVQGGNLDMDGVSGRTDSLNAEIIYGFSGGIDLGRPEGGLTLRNVEGENLALKKPSSNRPEVFDGDPGSVWTVNVDAINTAATVDLLTPRLVNEVRVLTAGENMEDFEANSLRGYAVQVSNDGFQWTEMGVLNDIEEKESTTVEIDELFARFVRVVIAQVDPLRRSRVAEIQVFGTGATPSGAYVSRAIDLGSPGRKNFGRIRWGGNIPEGASISLQFRSANEDDENAWSDWNDEITEFGAELVVPEPRNLLQYRVNLSAEFEDLAPRLDSLAIEFTDTFPVSQARGWVVPNSVILGRDTTYTYTLDLAFGDDDAGVERLFIAMPSLATNVEVTLPAGVTEKERVILGNGLEISFVEPGWNSDGTLEVNFVARLLTNEFDFSSQFFAPNSDEILNGEENTTAGRSWSVRATDVVGSVLSSVRVHPEVITPNGDGSNDATVVEFTLSRVSEPQDMEISILDLSGRVVRKLESRLVGGQYLRPPISRDLSSTPGFWDGRDDQGDVVPPGIYLVRVKARLDRGDEIRIRPVAVAY